MQCAGGLPILDRMAAEGMSSLGHVGAHPACPGWHERDRRWRQPTTAQHSVGIQKPINAVAPALALACLRRQPPQRDEAGEARQGTGLGRRRDRHGGVGWRAAAGCAHRRRCAQECTVFSSVCMCMSGWAPQLPSPPEPTEATPIAPHVCPQALTPRPLGPSPTSTLWALTRTHSAGGCGAMGCLSPAVSGSLGRRCCLRPSVGPGFRPGLRLL